MNKPDCLFKDAYTEDFKLLKQINNKLNDYQTMITKADKCNILVIIQTNYHSTKTKLFFNENNVKSIKIDPTSKYAKEINRILNKLTALFDECTQQ